MKRKPHTPTRTCPHRWCKPLHLAPAPFVLALMAFQLWNNLAYLVIIGSCFLMVWIVPKVIHYKPRQRNGPVTIKMIAEDIRDSPSPLTLEMEDAKYAGTGWRMLEVRKAWAMVAVGCDILMAAQVALISTVVFTNPQEEAQRISAVQLDASVLIGLVLGVLIFGFTLYAHKKATQPRKPKRAWVPAFLRAES